MEIAEGIVHGKRRRRASDGCGDGRNAPGVERAWRRCKSSSVGTRPASTPPEATRHDGIGPYCPGPAETNTDAAALCVGDAWAMRPRCVGDAAACDAAACVEAVVKGVTYVPGEFLAFRWISSISVR